MSQNAKQITHRLGAVFYVLWGVLHIYAVYLIYVLGTTQEPGMVQGRLYQDAWNLLYLSIFVIVVAVVYNWRNSSLGYWLNLITVSVTDIGFVVLILVPGYSTDILGPILWILGAIFSTIGFLINPKTA